MALVTMELRNVLKHNNFKLFDFDYHITHLDWKQKLEQKIIDRYYFHEIGSETVDRWHHDFKTKIREIMPYYNELYNTTLLGYNPLLTEKLEIIESMTHNKTHTTDQEEQGTVTHSALKNNIINETQTNTEQVNTQEEGEVVNTESTTGNKNKTRDNINNSSGETSAEQLVQIEGTVDKRQSDFPQHLNPQADILSGQEFHHNRENTLTTNTGNNITQQRDYTQETEEVGDEKLIVNTEEKRNTKEGSSNINKQASNNENAQGSEQITNSTGINSIEEAIQEQTKIIEGFKGIPISELIKMHRENILRIDEMILAELKTLFILVY